MSPAPIPDRRLARDHRHRGGLAGTLKRLRPDPGLIDRMGGPEVLERVVDRLYEGIAEDPMLRPFFGGRVLGEHRNQKRFFEEWAGGEPRYRRAGFGHGMYLLHYRLGIDHKSAGRWLQYLVKAMRAENVPKAAVREVAQVLGPMAHAMVHGDGSALPPELRKPTTEDLRAALEREPDLFERHRGEGRRLLFRAAEAGDAEQIRCLVEAGVSPDGPLLRDGLMRTPWCAARAAGHDATAAVLLDLGASVDIFSAAFLGDLELIDRLLDIQPDWVDAEDPATDLRGIQPVHHAIGGGRPEAALLLLERGARLGPDGARLLRRAADAGMAELVEALIAAGARAEDVGPGPWVLHPEISRSLVDAGADVNRPAGAWLHFCTSRFGQSDRPDLVRRLLELGADPDAEDHGAGPLHLAAGAGHVGILAELLAAGLDPNAPDEAGETPLAHVSWAVRSADRATTVKLLLERGADPSLRGRAGVSAAERLRRARSRDRESVLAFLRSTEKNQT